MQARYLYSVVRSGSQENLGNIGIQESEVYTIPFHDLAAVVHSCEAQPYDTRDRRQAEEWVLEHSYVIDQATAKYGTVLPFSFDVLLKGDDAAVRDWLCRGYLHLNSELYRLNDCAEYSIQIYYDYHLLAEDLMKTNPELAQLRIKIDQQPKGRAYLQKRQFEMQLREQVLGLARKTADGLFSQIEKRCREIRVEKGSSSKKERFKDKEHLVSFVCLFTDEEMEEIGDLLEDVDSDPGFSVRFTGPWAPFSFVRLEAE